MAYNMAYYCENNERLITVTIAGNYAVQKCYDNVIARVSMIFFLLIL